MTVVYLCKNCKKEFIPKYKKQIYCSRKCLSLFVGKRKSDSIIEAWKNGDDSGERGIKSKTFSSAIRRYIFEKYNNSCSYCGFNTLHPIIRKSILQIHHIDEDPTNNKEENLILLCPNCHALADSKNTRKGNGRRYERQKFRDETNNLFTGAEQ